MEIELKRIVKFFSGKDSEDFAKRAVESIGQKLGKVDIIYHPDGEIEPSYEETVRDAHVFIILSTNSNDNIMELGLLIDAAKRAAAARVIAVIPYYGYARQDRKGRPRVSIGAKFLANILEKAAGVDGVITLDLHADQIQGFFDIPINHIFASKVYYKYIVEDLHLDNIVIASADMGGTKRANYYANKLHFDLAVAHKTRLNDNSIRDISTIGNVEGCNVIIIEDMVATAGTMCKSALAYKNAGAKSIRGLASHGVLPGNAIKTIEESVLEEIIIGDTIPLSQKVKDSSKIKVVSMAELFGSTMNDIAHSRSIEKNIEE